MLIHVALHWFNFQLQHNFQVQPIVKWNHGDFLSFCWLWSLCWLDIFYVGLCWFRVIRLFATMWISTSWKLNLTKLADTCRCMLCSPTYVPPDNRLFDSTVSHIPLDQPFKTIAPQSCDAHKAQKNGRNSGEEEKGAKPWMLFSNIFQLQVSLIEIIRLCSLEYSECVYIIAGFRVFAFLPCHTDDGGIGSRHKSPSKCSARETFFLRLGFFTVERISECWLNVRENARKLLSTIVSDIVFPLPLHVLHD